VPPGAHEVTLPRENRHAVVPRIGHIEQPIRADIQAPGLAQSPTNGRGRRVANAAQELALRAEHGDAAAVGVGHVDRPVLVEGNAARPDHPGHFAQRALGGDLAVNAVFEILRLADVDRAAADPRVPHLGGDLLVHKEVHAVGDGPLAHGETVVAGALVDHRPLARAAEGGALFVGCPQAGLSLTAELFGLNAHGLPVSAVVAVPPDVPQPLAVVRRGDVGLVRAEHFRHAVVGQVEILLHRPPQADIAEFVVAVAQNGAHIAHLLAADDDHARPLQRARVYATRLPTQEAVVGIVAEVPREGPRRLIVEDDAHGRALVGDRRNAIHLVHHRLDRRAGVGIDQELSRVVVVDETGQDRRARGQHGQHQRAREHRRAAKLPPAQRTAQPPDDVHRAAQHQQRAQPAPAGDQVFQRAPAERRPSAPHAEHAAPQGQQCQR